MVTRTARLTQAVRALVKADLAALSDRDLLRRFASANDQAAFAALVMRHKAMVLGVCCRSLPHLHDAEDACQAVFLLLAKKAGGIRWQASVANWLYTTARKVAHNARVAAARRARRESRAAQPEAVSPADALGARELLGILDEELDKLAPRYREPLILCYLEGLTRDEAAVRLGVPLATLKSQIERGRKKLAEALIKRGCTLGSALLVTAATATAGASWPRLLESILATIGGSPSSAVAELVRGIAMNGMLIRAKLLTIAVVAVAAMGLGFTSFLPGTAKPQKLSAEETVQTAPAPAASSKDKAAPPTPDAKERTFTGKVVDRDGKPVVAQLHLIWNDDKPELLGKTNEDGTFQVTVTLKTPATFLVAKADGHGIDFAELKADAPAELTLSLPKDQRIRGRIIDPQGKPVAGAIVQFGTVSVYQHDSIQPFLDFLKKRTNLRDGVNPRERILYNMSNLPFGAVTNGDGRFELNGAGAERLVSFKISGAGRAETLVHVITRQGFDAKPFNDVTLSLRPAPDDDFEKLAWSFNPILWAPDFTLAIEPEKLVRGRLTDAKTGKPRAGVDVWLGQEDGIDSRHLRGTTNADGKYEIHGAKKWATNDLQTKADEINGYLPCLVIAKDTIGYEPLVADITCPKGVVVKGILRDKATGQPIAGRVHVVPLVNNPYLKNYPTVNHWYSNSERAYPKSDGAYRVLMIPGPTLLVGHTGTYSSHNQYRPPRPDPKYPDVFKVGREDGSLEYLGPNGSIGSVDGNWCKVIDVKETDTELVQDIELEPAPQKAVRVVDAQGKPVKGVHATGINWQSWHYAEPIGDTDAITIWNLEPNQSRLVVARHHERKLVGAMMVKEAVEKPVLKLGPGGTVKGRLVDAAGKPLAGITVRLHFDRREVAEIYGPLFQGPQAVTDTNGEFAFDTLAPGFKFCFFFSKGKKRLGPDYDKGPRHIIDTHGEVKNLGDLRIDPLDQRNEE